MDTQSNRLVLHDYPWFNWIAGALVLAFGLSNLLSAAFTDGTVALAVRAAVALGGALLLLTGSVLTVRADRAAQTLTLDYRSVFKHNVKEYPFSQIEGIQLDISRSRSSNGGSGQRVVVVLKDGGMVPFRSYYSNGMGGKHRTIKRLRDFIGVGGSEFGMSLMGSLREVTKITQQTSQKLQEEMTGSEAEVHETSGISWQVQTQAFGGSPITRWLSPDFTTPNGFLYLAQKVEGQKTETGGLLGGMGSMLLSSPCASTASVRMTAPN